MKITALKTFTCDVYRTNWVFVKVFTDTEIYGVGEATLEMRELTVVQAIKELERYIVGRNPHDIEAIWHDIYRDAYWRGGPVLMSALASVEMALWDIKGKALGVPVYQLLGGKIRNKVPCYANGWFSKAKTPDEFAEKAIIAANQGYQGIKWDPFGKAYMNISRTDLNNSLACIKEVHKAVGDRIHIIIEGHGRFNVPTAIKIGKALAEFDVLWFEEPIPPDDIQGIKEIKSRVPVQISGGERLYSRWDFKDYIHNRCVDYIQPDVSHVGGIMELKKIAVMAECHYIPVCPHNPSGPVANAATLQLAACIPNFYLLETMNTDVDYRSIITNEKIKLENGEMYISDKPGLGIDINEEEIKKYPYQPHNLRHYSGNLTNIRPDNAKEITK